MVAFASPIVSCGGTLRRPIRLAFYETNRVTAHLNTSVAHLDAEARRLRTAGGDVFTYDRCLVASGARPSVPPIAGLREALAAAG